MSDSLFAYNYGTLQGGLFSSTVLTNPAELIRGEELYRMLRLCGEQECACGDSASDWEVLFAFSKALPSLAGFGAASRMHRLLQKACGMEEGLTKANAHVFWQRGVARFEKERIPLSSFLLQGVPVLTDASTLQEHEGVPLAMDAASLLPCGASSFEEWRAYVKDCIFRFFESGCRTIRFCISHGCEFAEPNPYRVGEILQKKRRSAGEYSILAAQLFREVCTHATPLEMNVLVEAHRDTDALPFLIYAEQSVGLPNLCLATEDPVISLQTQSLAVRCASKFTLALLLSAFPVEHELENALLSVAARYPIGRLTFVTGGDLRLVSFEESDARARICRIMEKNFEKK